MIVFDTSTLVSATFRADTPPFLAVLKAFDDGAIAVSDPVFDELTEVLFRPVLARHVNEVLRTRLLTQLRDLGAWFDPTEELSDCRDANDNKFLELALAASAHSIVSSDLDLPVLHPWRGVRILRSADYLAAP